MTQQLRACTYNSSREPKFNSQHTMRPALMCISPLIKNNKNKILRTTAKPRKPMIHQNVSPKQSRILKLFQSWESTIPAHRKLKQDDLNGKSMVSSTNDFGSTEYPRQKNSETLTSPIQKKLATTKQIGRRRKTIKLLKYRKECYHTGMDSFLAMTPNKNY